MRQNVGALLMLISIVLSGYIGYKVEYWYLIPFGGVLYVFGYYGYRYDHLKMLENRAGYNIFVKEFHTYYLSGFITCAVVGGIGYGIHFLF